MADKRYGDGFLRMNDMMLNHSAISIIATISEISGAGFRLSLLLNAVGVEMATANREIQATAKEITLFSLMLKQVGLAMDVPEVTASPSALETARGIAVQSQNIFTEIKDTVEMSQNRDETGNIRSITVAGPVQSWFRRQRVQYLIGQLISLKLSLAIMLQIFQLGKNIAKTRSGNLSCSISPANTFLGDTTRIIHMRNKMTCKNERRFRIWWWCDIGPWWTCNGYITWQRMKPCILLLKNPRRKIEKGSKSKAIHVFPLPRRRMRKILQKPWSNTKRPL